MQIKNIIIKSINYIIALVISLLLVAAVVCQFKLFVKQDEYIVWMIIGFFVLVPAETIKWKIYDYFESLRKP